MKPAVAAAAQTREASEVSRGAVGAVLTLASSREWPMRAEIALRAVYEIDSAANLLLMVRDDEVSIDEPAVRCLLSRVGTLTSGILAALTEELGSPANIFKWLFPGEESDDADVGGSGMKPAVAAAAQTGEASEVRRGAVGAVLRLPASREWPMRAEIALRVVYEIDSAANLLLMVRDDEVSIDEPAVRFLLSRVGTLTGGILAALTDEIDSPANIFKRLFPGEESDDADVGGAG